MNDKRKKHLEFIVGTLMQSRAFTQLFDQLRRQC